MTKKIDFGPIAARLVQMSFAAAGRVVERKRHG